MRINFIRFLVSFVLFFSFLTTIWSVDIENEVYLDITSGISSGGISFVIEEKMIEHISIKGKLLYNGSNNYDSSCLVLYNWKNIATGGGIVFKLENKNLFPGIQFEVKALQEKPISVYTNAALFFYQENVLKFQGLETTLGVHLINENYITDIYYQFSRANIQSTMTHSLGINLETFQEGFPIRVTLFGESDIIAASKLVVNVNGGGGIIADTKRFGEYFIKAKGYFTTDDNTNLPLCSVSTGFRLSLE